MPRTIFYIIIIALIRIYANSFRNQNQHITVKKLETVGSSSSAQDAAIKMRDKQVSSVLVSP